MGLVDWRIVVAVGVVGLFVLLIGLRGKRVDLTPRCKRRWCRYDLSAFVNAETPETGYPVTCPECGHVAQSQREVKWGRRRARRRVAWFGAAVLVLSALVGGVEVYARATNANTLAWMPLWLIMERAEHDTYQNAYPHQSELLRRADAKEITGPAARRVIARILEWQQDDTVFWGVLGDVFASLALNGEATQEDIKQFWANVWEFELVARPTVEQGSVPTVQVHGHWRGHWRRQLIYQIEDGDDLWLPSHFSPNSFDVPVRVMATHGDEIIALELAHDGKLFGRGGDGYFGASGFVSVWRIIAQTGAWDEVRGLTVPYTISLEGFASPPGLSETLMDGRRLSAAHEIAAAGLLASWPVSGEARIEPTAPGVGAVEIVTSPAMQRRMASEALAILRVYRGQLVWIDISLGDVTKGFGRERLDAALSYSIVLKSPDGREAVQGEPLLSRTLPAYGQVHSLEGGYASWFADRTNLPTIILRPDPVHALRTTDVTRVLGGEIEIPIVVDVVPPGAAIGRPGQMSTPPPPPAQTPAP